MKAISKLQAAKMHMPELPSMQEYIQQKVTNEYNSLIVQKVQDRCSDLGYNYSPERIVTIVTDRRDTLHYYRTDTGSLQPLIAFSEMEVSFSEDNVIEGAKVTLSCNELHPDIFKP